MSRKRSAAAASQATEAVSNHQKYTPAAALNSPSYIPSHLPSPSSSFAAASSSSWNPLNSFSIFRAQAPLLYDVCSSYGLLWPSLSTQWLIRDAQLLLDSPHCPPSDSSVHAYEMLIGTHTSGQYSNSITLGHVQIPNKRSFDPLQEFVKHPIVAPSHQATKPSPTASTAAPLASNPDLPSTSDDDEKQYCPYPIPQYGSVTLKTVSKIRTTHELHRIRPLNSPYLTQQMHGTVATTSAIVNSDDMTDAPAASSLPIPSHPYGPKTLAAVKSPEPYVIIYDIPTKPWLSEVSNSKSVGKGAHTSRLVCLTGQTTGGWSIDWNYCKGSEPGTSILSGDDNGAVCVWNLNDAEIRSNNKAIQNYIPARQTWSQAHSGPINEMSWFKCSHPNNFTSVGDDLMLKVWDVRSMDVCAAVQAHDREVTSLSTSPFRGNDILTASKDGTIKLWDIRQMKELAPVHTFTGHGDGVLQIAFAPFDYHGGSIFASSSSDRRIFIWDASLVGEEIDAADLQENGPPELMFVHAGHTDSIEDFSWHPTHPWLLSSVSADNVLQIWEIFEGVHAPVDPRDQSTVRAIDRILQKPTLSHDEKHQFVPFDLSKCMKAIPDELFSDLFTASSVDPLKQSNTLPFATSFIKNYSTKIDSQLQQMDRTEAQLMGDAPWNDDEDENMIVEDESSERSSLSNSRPSTARKRRKELTEPTQVSIKMKSISVESSPVKSEFHTPQPTRVKSFETPVSSSRKSTKRTTSTPMPPEVLEDIRSLRHWHRKARLLGPRTASGRIATAEAEYALQKVMDLVSEEPDSDSSASEQERNRTRKKARTKTGQNNEESKENNAFVAVE